MKVFVQSVNFNADKDLMEYIQKKVGILEKFHSKIVDAKVFLKVQKTSEVANKVTEILVRIPGHEVIHKCHTKVFEEGINLSVNSLKRQLVNAKEKEMA